MATGSPAMRLGANRPPSTFGRTASMTARALPSATLLVSSARLAPGAAFFPLGLRLALATAFPAQHDGGQGRQRQRHRLGPAMRADRDRLDGTEIPPAGAAVFARVRVDDFAPKSALRHPDHIIVPRERCEIAYHEQGCRTRGGLAQERDHAHLRVVGIHPLKSFMREIDLMQRRLGAINTVQVADEALYAGMTRHVGDPPFEFAFMGPFAALRKLSAHE